MQQRTMRVRPLRWSEYSEYERVLSSQVCPSNAAFPLVLVLLSLLVLLFDHSFAEQMREFVSSGRLPDFAAFTRLVAYLIATSWTTKQTRRFPGWLACPAYGISVSLCLSAASC